MPTSRSRAPASRALLLALALAACGEAGPAPAVPKPPPAQAAAPSPAVAAAPVPALRTGAIAPVDHPEPIVGKIAVRQLGDVWETLAVELRRPAGIATAYGLWNGEAAVALEQDGPAPYAFVAPPTAGLTGVMPEDFHDEVFYVWVRRPRALAGKPVAGTIFVASRAGEPGHRLRFRAEPTSEGAARAAPGATPVERRWATVLAEHLEQLPNGTPFQSFAARRLRERFAPRKGAAGAPADPGSPTGASATGHLEVLMGTFTGATWIQEMIQSNHGPSFAAFRQKPTIPLAQVPGVGLALPPWADMLRRIGVAPGAPASEPLAAAAPAEFWFARGRRLVALLDTLDAMDAIGAHAADFPEMPGEQRDLPERYQAELGLARGALTRELGPAVVAELAAVGSDAYLNEGTDVTFLFRLHPKKQPLFDAAVANALAGHGASHGGIAVTTTRIEGVEVKVARSPDGAVRQHRASAGDLEIVSNSPGALRRVLATIQKKHPALSEELGFQYVIARDAGARGGDVLVFLGDRFVAEVVGPRQKILEARRQIARAELQTPGFAALLHGLVTGASPASTDALVASGFLRKDELRHTQGGAAGAVIAFQPGRAAQSAWGTPAALTPLVDRPEPARVTEAEAEAYQRFASEYRDSWRDQILPIAIRVDAPQEGPLRADLRILPILGPGYDSLLRGAGRATVEVAPLGRGARVVLGVGQDATMRFYLDQFIGEVARTDRLKLDWLGDWAMLGVDDDPALARVLLGVRRDLPQRPLTDEERKRTRGSDFALLSRLPVYAAVDVKDEAGLSLALVAARQMMKEANPGMFTWAEHEERRGVPIVRVSIRDEDPDGGRLDVFYAVAEGALYVALQEQVIRRLVDDALDGRAPRPGAPGAAAPQQLVLEAVTAPRGPLATVLGWLLEADLRDDVGQPRAAAEMLLRGAPEVAQQDERAQRALAMAYLGHVPVTPSGKLYTRAPEGPRDPDRGTPHAPVWPALPVPGSPVDALLARLPAVRAAIAFDDEPGGGKGRDAILSLHVRLSLGAAAP